MALTRIQDDVLDVVRQHGPLTVRDVGYHLLMDDQRARAVLGQLEAKGLVGRNYTSHRRRRSQFAFEVQR